MTDIHKYTNDKFEFEVLFNHQKLESSCDFIAQLKRKGSSSTDKVVQKREVLSELFLYEGRGDVIGIENSLKRSDSSYCIEFCEYLTMLDQLKALKGKVNVLCISTMTTPKPFRGRGFASIALEMIKSYAHEQKYHFLILQCGLLEEGMEYSRLEKFYLDRGFSLLGDELSQTLMIVFREYLNPQFNEEEMLMKFSHL